MKNMCFANIYCHWDHLNLSQFFTPTCEIGITLPHKNNKANQILIDSFQIGCYDRKQNEWVDLCINPNNHDKQYFIKVELRVMADDNSVCMCVKTYNGDGGRYAIINGGERKRGEGFCLQYFHIYYENICFISLIAVRDSISEVRKMTRREGGLPYNPEMCQSNFLQSTKDTKYDATDHFLVCTRVTTKREDNLKRESYNYYQQIYFIFISNNNY